MGKIQNIAKITDDPQLNIRRSDIEQRAEWFFFMNDEAEKRGIDWAEYCRPAIRRVGHLRGEESLCAAVQDRSDLQQILNMFRNPYI